MAETMKRRVTYIVSKEDAADPTSHVKAIDKNAVAINGLSASKHVRIRVPHPADEALGTVSVQWARARLFDLPFDPPAELGTHIDASVRSSVPAVQSWMAGLGLEIGEPIEADTWFSWISNDAPKPSRPEFADLRNADAVRISTNPSTGEVIAEAWFKPSVWTETVETPAEVGVLTAQNSDGEITLHGRVRKLGTDDISDPMLIHWYPRHRAAAGHAAARFVEPYGLHPTLELAIDSVQPLPLCRLFAKLDLPREVFIDEYQLEDLPRYDPPSELLEVWGETDLELPVWNVNKGSIGLFMLEEPGKHQIPLHFRYARPDAALKLEGVLPEPSLYWSCRDDRMPKRRNLEDHESIGIASAYPLENTAFYVIDSNPVPYRVPAIAPQHARTAEISTLVVVSLGFLAVLFTVLRSLRQPKMKKE